jgi:ribosome-binding factor A
MMSIRAERVAEAIRRIASETIHNEVKDPRIKVLITVTKVLGNEKEKVLVEKGLRSATPYIRKCIGDGLKLRYIPEIVFKIDEEIEREKRIDSLLDTWHKEAEG